MIIKFKMEGKKCLTKCPNGRRYNVYSNGCYHDCEYYQRRIKRTKTGGEMECFYPANKQSSRKMNKEGCADIREDNLRSALKEFTDYMASRMAEKEAKGYTGWDGSYPRGKLWKEIKSDLILIESGKAQTKHIVDICNRLFMIDYKSSPSDFKVKEKNKIMCREDYLNLRQLQIDILKTSTPSQIHRFELGLYSLDTVLKDASLNFKQEAENGKKV